MTPHRTIQPLVVCLLLLSSPWRPAAADDLAGVLDLVPPDAVAWAVSPSLSRLNADLSDLIDRANRPELAIAGRPVDVVVSQFGVAAGFDERGAFAIWSPSIEDLQLGAGVVAVPVEDAKRFLEANFEPEPDGGPGAVRRPDGTLLFSRTLAGHVLLAPRRDLVDAWKASDTGVRRLTDAFGAPALDDMRRADLLLRIEGEAVERLQSLARAQAEAGAAAELPFDLAGLADRVQEASGGVEDIVVGLDADALALGVRGWTRYAAESDVAEVAQAATAGGSPLADLPRGPFYFAGGIDLAAFGGVEGFDRLRAVLGDALPVPADPGVSDTVSAISFVVRPSKLGVAMGGILNDASLVIATEDPEEVRALVEQAVRAADGVDGAIERSASFERSVEQRKGGVADQITMRSELAPKEKREADARVGDASIELTATRLVVGPRGLQGLGRIVDDTYVVTFSRRPDVMERTEAAIRGKDGLDDDPVLSSMASWLPPDPGLEMFLDLGRLADLARQVAKLVPGADQAIPKLGDAMPPVGFGLGLVQGDAGSARIEWGAVVPSEVIGTLVGIGMEGFGPSGAAAE